MNQQSLLETGSRLMRARHKLEKYFLAETQRIPHNPHVIKFLKEIMEELASIEMELYRIK